MVRQDTRETVLGATMEKFETCAKSEVDVFATNNGSLCPNAWILWSSCDVTYSHQVRSLANERLSIPKVHVLLDKNKNKSN